MKPSSRLFWAAWIVGLALSSSVASAITIQLSASGSALVAPGDNWQFFRGTTAPSEPPDAWVAVDFDDSGWETGPSGFGYGDNDDATVLSDMLNSYRTVYIRHTLTLAEVAGDQTVELEIDYDDGFVAYLNGAEVARRNMPAGTPTYLTDASPDHEAGTPVLITLGSAADLLQPGDNVLAIEGHNGGTGSSDFSLIPALRTVSGSAVANGSTWILQSSTANLRGTVASAQAVSVRLAGIDASFDPASRAWSGTAALQPGLNTVTVEARDAAQTVLETASIELVYVPAANLISGEVGEDATWSDAVILEGTVTILPDTIIQVAPGTQVLLSAGATLVVQGQLLADGTEAEPIRFTHYGDGTRWERLLFLRADDSLLRHCIVEFANCEGDHKDYYDDDCDPDTPPLPRFYHEAVVALASHLDIEHCLFQNLPDAASGGEGDAIAIVADDPEFPGEASANIRSSRFIRIGAGVHTRFAYVLVEYCYFTGHYGDNDDVDLYGESTPPPLVRYNLFLNPSYDDMVNPTRCSAIFIGNVIAGANDHGIVLRDKCAPVLINNLIYDCSSAGIAVQNQCNALLINNTIANCGRGIRFFDHTGRWGPPYCLFPGSGLATLINCIIWDCTTTIELADSPWTEDRGSHITLLYCDVQGGPTGRTSVSANSTLTWGEGCFDANPQFVNAAGGDYHLTPLTSPALDAGTNLTAFLTLSNLLLTITNDYDGTPRPLDSLGDGLATFDLGAYESLLATADSNGDGIPDGWYAGHGLNPADPTVSQGNPDQDAYSTGDEYLADTDPTDGNSFLHIATITKGSPVTIHFPSSSNRLYTLLFTTDLTDPVWTVVPGQTDQPGQGGMDTLQDDEPAPARYYRLEAKMP